MYVMLGVNVTTAKISGCDIKTVRVTISACFSKITKTFVAALIFPFSLNETVLQLRTSWLRTLSSWSLPR